MTLSVFSDRRESTLLFLGCGAIVAVGTYYSHRDLVAWLLFALSFVVIAVDPLVRHDKHLKYGVWLTLIAHHGVALLYVYGPGYVPVNVDADSTHHHAVLRAMGVDIEFGIGQSLFQNVLGYVYRLSGYYRLGGESLLLGKQLSILAYTLSCVVLVRFYALLNIDKHKVTLILLYGLMPTLLLYTSITLREGWIVLLFMTAMLSGMRFVHGGAMVALASLTTSVCILGVLHKGLMFMALFVFVSFLAARILRARDEARSLIIIGAVLVLLMTGSIFVIAKYDATDSGVVRALIAGRVLDFIGGSRELIDDARSTFDVSLDTSTYTALIPSFIPVYAHYMFGPFPWQISSAKDLYAMSESLARLLLILFALHAWRKASGAERLNLSIMLIMYLVITMLWAVGTTNYGQALRHHVTSTWILILAGGPGLLKNLLLSSRSKLKT